MRLKIFLWIAVFVISLPGCAPASAGEPAPAPAFTNAPPAAATGTAPPPPPALPDGETVRSLMLASPGRWDTVWAEADGGQRIQVWFSQPLRTRALSGPPDGPPDALWISDGAYQLNSLMAPGETVEPLPEYVLDPQPPPAADPNGLPPEPPGAFIVQPLSHMLFPLAQAGRPGTYTTTGREVVAGRETYVLDWTPSYASNRLDTFWVDAQTGVVLRWLNYSKPDGAELTAETTITRIQFNLQLPPELFDIARPLPAAFASGPYDF